jgi:hypothetical protein
MYEGDAKPASTLKDPSLIAKDFFIPNTNPNPNHPPCSTNQPMK